MVALEHMQVHYTTVGRRKLSKFRWNVISFPQDVVGFAKRMGGMLQQYEVGERVNSSRGPVNGLDPTRPSRRANDPSVSAEEKETCDVDEDGALVYGAEVVEVRGPEVVLRYDVGGTVVEWQKDVVPRARMPWHPKYLKGDFSIMLRRSMKPGVMLEGLEVRWGLVSELLQPFVLSRLCRL